MMDITVAKKDLLKLVARMQGVAEKKSTMPVLANVLLDAGMGALRLSATDLYLALSGQVAADVKKPGSVAVPAKDLLERVKAMPDGPITLASADGFTLVIKTVGSARKFTMRGIAGAEFPALPQPDAGAPTMTLAVDVLLDLIARTSAAISTDETRAHLNSALFEWERDVVRMVTTDGHRLTKMEAKVDGQATATMLLPLKAVHELRRLCEDVASVRVEPGTEAGDVEIGKKPSFEITRSGPNAFFRAGGTLFSVKTVDAQFPPYAQVIPKNNPGHARVPRGLFLDAIRAMAISSPERTGGVKLAFEPGKLTISSESPDRGDGLDEVLIEYSGKPLLIGFNAKYVLDALGALDDDDVSLSLGDELGAVLLRPESEIQFTAVLMPMRI